MPARTQYSHDDEAEKGTFAERAREKSRDKLKATIKVKSPEPWDEPPVAEERAETMQPVQTIAAVVMDEIVEPEPEPVPSSVPMRESGRNAREYITNWREFTTEREGLLFTALIPHGPKAGKKIAALSSEDAQKILGLVTIALRNNFYEAQADAARIDWLTPEELRAMDQALCNTLELAQGDQP